MNEPLRACSILPAVEVEARRSARVRRLLHWTAGLSIALAPFAAFHARAAALFTSEEQHWIDTHPVVRFAAGPGAQPFDYVEDGKHRGLTADYLDALARISGLEFERVDTTRWGSPTAAFAAHEIDLLPNVAYGLQNDVLQREATFSSPYLVGSAVIVTRESQTVIFDLDKLSGQTIAVRSGGAYERFLRQHHPSIRLLSTLEQRDMLDAVATGRADAAIGLDAMLVPAIRSSYSHRLYISGAVANMPAVIVMATRKDLPVLASIIDKSLNSLTARDVNELTTHWLYSSDFGAPSLRAITHYYTIEIVLGVFVVSGFAMLAFRSRAQYRLTAESEARKSRFIAVMSHEIRTPLNAIVSAIDLLSRAKLGPMEKQLADTAVKASASLVGMLDDVLDISKLHAKKLRLAHVASDIRTVAESAVIIMRAQADAKGLPLELHLDAPDHLDVYIDQTRIRQILVNLLSNAIKFTDAGRVCVDVKLAIADPPTHAPGELTLKVSDTGVGIPKNRQDRLFDAFEQADSTTTRRFGGTGLGLTICKELVALMGGTLALDSKERVGTSVTVVIPVDTAQREVCAPVDRDAVADSPSNARADRPRVLVVEDQPLNAELIRLQLAELHCDATIANTGQAALGLLDDQAFALVLLDCNLPDIDGYEVARRIRAARRNATTYLPVIAISALTDHAHLHECIAAGMDGSLRKPLMLDDVASIIDLWCRAAGVADGSAGSSGSSSPAERHIDLPRLASLFATTCAEDSALIGSALARGDFKRAASCAHRIKSAAHVMREHDIAQTAERLERALSAPDVNVNAARRNAAKLARLVSGIAPDRLSFDV
ncbi:hpt domain protein [Burkholderia pseudomallei MSHR5492]|uniref:ATP-binding protein n=1 Tax=Burkholderia pseudomallei TaxID=28450 RepID=UPI0005320427|nr:ATP-binding protein [Burkholderia pseudomallei]KGS51774.1 hpt domain protein [Burkholderia pseudomallei MSHR5492]ONC26474.1 ABC transporter substrate-binding protein [Burkholderia pseudomallei]